MPMFHRLRGLLRLYDGSDELVVRAIAAPEIVDDGPEILRLRIARTIDVELLLDEIGGAEGGLVLGIADEDHAPREADIGDGLPLRHGRADGLDDDIGKKELNIYGSRNAQPEDFRAVIDYLQRGDCPYDKLITSVVKPEEAAEAMKHWHENPGKVFRILVEF